MRGPLELANWEITVAASCWGSPTSTNRWTDAAPLPPSPRGHWPGIGTLNGRGEAGVFAVVVRSGVSVPRPAYRWVRERVWEGENSGGNHRNSIQVIAIAE